MNDGFTFVKILSIFFFFLNNRSNYSRLMKQPAEEGTCFNDIDKIGD